MCVYVCVCEGVYVGGCVGVVWVCVWKRESVCNNKDIVACVWMLCVCEGMSVGVSVV